MHSQERSTKETGTPLLHPSPQYWCISWEDLVEFEKKVRKVWETDQVREPCEKDEIPQDEKQYLKHHKDPLIGPTIRTVTTSYIVPMLEDGKSWAEMRAEMKHPKRIGACTIFITHSWAEGVFEFCSKVQQMREYYNFCSKVQQWRKHFTCSYSEERACLYICFLSNPQPFSPGDVLTETPFHQALQDAQYVLAVPNKATSIYMRLWCVFEIHTAIKKKDIQIDLPWLICSFDVVSSMLFTTLLMIAGMIFSWKFLADRYANWFGPLLWLLVAFSSLNLTRNVYIVLSHRVSQHYPEFQHRFSQRFIWLGPRWKLGLLMIESFLFGIAIAFSYWHFSCKRPYHDGVAIWPIHNTTGVRFQPGEYLSCCIVAISVFLSVWETVLRMVISYLIQLSAYDLNLETVEKAECANSDDYVNIWELITEEHSGDKQKAIKTINKSINILREVGSYDQTVLKNLERHLPPGLVRNGRSLSKICVACAFWECWWMADLACHGRCTTAVVMFAVSMIVACFFAFCVSGGHSIFAIETSLWIGFIFILITNSPAFFTRKAVQACMMTESTWWFNLASLSVLFIANWLFYKDYLHWGLSTIINSIRKFPAMIVDWLVDSSGPDVPSDDSEAESSGSEGSP